MIDTVLSARGLTLARGGTTVLADVDVQVGAGARMAVVGPSGAGKTTLLRLLAQLEAPDSGEVVFTGGAAGRGVRVGLVFQDLALFSHMRVWRNVAFSLLVRGVDRKTARRRAEEVLEQAGLLRCADRLPQALSGGERQRVALLRTLVSEPDVVLLDEPFANLDPPLVEHFSAWLDEQQRRTGVAVVMVTHDVRYAMAWADELILLNEGRVVQSGAPADIYREPVDSFAASFTGLCRVFEAEPLSGGDGRFAIHQLGPGAEVVVANPLGLEDDRRRIAVRPHDVSVRGADRGAPGIGGTVVGVSFSAGVTTYDVLLAGDVGISGTHAELSAPVFQRGAEVVVEWPPARAVALR